MYVLTEKLLAGTGTAPEAFPHLVRLLEFAAAPPGFAGDQHKEKKRFQRQWALVVEAAAAFIRSGAPDSSLTSVVPPESLRPLERRPAVATMIMQSVSISHEKALQP